MMRRTFPCAVLFVLLALTGLFGAGHAAADAGERILLFNSRITVHPDASMTVTETITVRSEGQEIKRGIVRSFPTTYSNRFGKTVRVRFEVESVQKNGASEPYHLKNELNGKRVFVGSENAFLDPGEYTYVLTYRTDRQLGYFTDFDELYWNVTGLDWSLPIDRAEAVIEPPPGARVLETAAYTGPKDAQGTDFETGRDAAGNVTFATTRPLGAGEGLTVAVSWPKGLVHEPTGKERFSHFFRDYPNFFTALIGLLVIAVYYILAWLRVGRDPARGTIIPLYAPPRDLSPAAVRHIRRMGFDHKAFAAAVIHMAVKGRLTIEEKDDEYTLRQVDSDGPPLSPDEAKLFTKLFSGGRSIVLKNTNHVRIKAAIKALKTTLAAANEKTYFVTNRGFFFPGLLMTLLAVVGVVLTPPINPTAGFMAIWLSMWTIGCSFLAMMVYRAFKVVFTQRKDRLKHIMGGLFITLFALPFFAGEIVGAVMFGIALSLPTMLLFLTMILLNPLFYFLLKAPTRLGRRLMDEIEGFRRYLSVAEQDRLNLLHSPERTPELFEKYLPYALALDVENQWSEQFASVLAASGEGSEYSPAWYSGTSWSTLGTAAFASSLGSSFSGAISSSSSAPGSSSGSGGGGSSGGGGGGGGGGGW